MTKEDLNRLFGDPEKHKTITPPDLLAAAHLIKEYCCKTPLAGCRKCIFHGEFGCVLFEQTPVLWDLLPAGGKTADWINKQYFQDRDLYTDTDTKRAPE